MCRAMKETITDLCINVGLALVLRLKRRKVSKGMLKHLVLTPGYATVNLLFPDTRDREHIITDTSLGPPPLASPPSIPLLLPAHHHQDALEAPYCCLTSHQNFT